MLRISLDLAFSVFKVLWHHFVCMLIRSRGRADLSLHISLTVLFCLLLSVSEETWGSCMGREISVAEASAALHSSHTRLLDCNIASERGLIPKYLHTSPLIMGRKVPGGRTKLRKQLWDGNTPGSPCSCFDGAQASVRSVANCWFFQVKENILGVFSLCLILLSLLAKHLELKHKWQQLLLWNQHPREACAKDSDLWGFEINIPFALHKVLHWLCLHGEGGCWPYSCCVAFPCTFSCVRSSSCFIQRHLPAHCMLEELRAEEREQSIAMALPLTMLPHLVRGSLLSVECNYQDVRLKETEIGCSAGMRVGRDVGRYSNSSSVWQSAIKWWLWNSGRRELVIFGARLVNVSQSCLPSHGPASQAW